MPVNDAMQSAEQEIDTSLSQLPIWRFARNDVLNATLDFHKGAYLTLSAVMAQAAMSGGQESITYVSAQLLQRLQAGCFQTLKWAFLWCPERSSQTCSEEMIRILSVSFHHQLKLEEWVETTFYFWELLPEPNYAIT